jgi:hypothetical protein
MSEVEVQQSRSSDPSQLFSMRLDVEWDEIKR